MQSDNPTYEQLSFMTETEKQSIKYECMMEKYIDGETTSVEKELYWKIWGKENCEYFKNLEEVSEPGEIALNGLVNINYGSLFIKPNIWLVGVCIIAGYAVKRVQAMSAYLQKLVGNTYNVVAMITDTRRFDEWQ